MCGRYDVPLSPRGQAQLDGLRERIAGEAPFAAVYCSTLRRAIGTAAAVPVPRPRLLRSLAEIDCGLLDGTPIEVVKREYAQIWAQNQAENDENFRWPGGESYTRFRRRVLRVVSGIAQAHAGQRVLIVTHAGVINQVLGTIAGQSPARWSNFRPHNASITRVMWDGSSGEVEVFDDYAHISTASTHLSGG